MPAYYDSLKSHDFVFIYPIILQKIYCMETTATRTSNSKYWLWCFIWLVILIIMLADVGGSRKFFWLALPGTLTYFAKGMDIL